MAELIAFIGGGQMAASLIGGLRAAAHPGSRIRVAEPDVARGRKLARDFDVDVIAPGPAIARGADALVLAVKPQAMQAATAGIALDASTTVISIAAGVRIAALKRWLGGAAPMIRCMPNTPALLRSGVTGLYAPKGTPEKSRQLAATILGAVGALCWVDEEAKLDAVTALSGSGPAYYFLLTEVLRDAGQALGLDAATARQLAARTFVGAARMADGDLDVAELRQQVTSKGGTTEAAVAHLEAHGLRQLFADALRAAAARARELGESLARA